MGELENDIKALVIQTKKDIKALVTIDQWDWQRVDMDVNRIIKLSNFSNLRSN